MRIYFVRHGESQANLLHAISNRGLKHGLTRTGREQASVLANILQAHAISRIYASPLLRAIETSIVLAHHLGVDYQVEDALREYDCGIWEGRSDEVAWQHWQELFDAWTVHQQWGRRLKGGECFYDVRERFVSFVEDLVQEVKHADDHVVCVSHGGVYRMMLPLVLRNIDSMWIARHGFAYTACVISEWRSEGLVCVEWNGQPVPV